MIHGFDIEEYIEISKEDLPNPVVNGEWVFLETEIDPITEIRFYLSYSRISGEYAVMTNAKYGNIFHLEDIIKRSTDTTFYMRPCRRVNTTGTNEPVFVK